MQIPKQLKIGGHIYRVVELDEVSKDPNTAGECDIDKLEIRLRKKQKQSAKEATLFHEIIHAINWEYDEKDVEFLAQALYQVLQDNKLLK